MPQRKNKNLIQQQSKPAWRSKTVLGAIATLLSAFSLLPWGITFDPETGVATINVYALAASGVGVTGGSVFAIFGRWVAKGPLDRLF